MRKRYYTLLNLILFLPLLSFADDGISYRAMVGIPGYDGTGNFSDFINIVYGLAISVAALLAVVKIVIAGVKWMLSDVVTSKVEAKADIQSALFGLIIIISAVLIITIINPTIVGA